MEIANLLNLFNQDLFISVVLLVLLIVYGFYALVLSIQIKTYNNIVTQAGFAPFFTLVGYLNVAAAIILISIILLTL
jgi:hypothetical protein